MPQDHRTGSTLPGGARWRDVGIVAVATVVGALLVAGLGVLMGPAYSSTAMVNGGPGSSASLPLDLSGDVTQRYVATELIYIDTLAKKISTNITAATGVQNPPPVQAKQDGNTNVIELTVVGDSPDQAAAMANSAAETYIADWRERTKQDPASTPADLKSDRFVQRATADDATKTTSLATLGLLGAILGFGVGVLVVYLLHRRAAAQADG